MRASPLRYLTLLLMIMGCLISLSLLQSSPHYGWLALLCGGLAGVGLYDLTQTKSAILRNYPILAHLRFLLEHIRPEIRQYFIEDDTVATPFSRNQRSIVYQRAKQALDKRPFGTQLNVYDNGYEWMNHSIAPSKVTSTDFRITIGAGRAQPYSASIFNISAMSFGSRNF